MKRLGNIKTPQKRGGIYKHNFNVFGLSYPLAIVCKVSINKLSLLNYFAVASNKKNPNDNNKGKKSYSNETTTNHLHYSIIKQNHDLH